MATLGPSARSTGAGRGAGTTSDIRAVALARFVATGYHGTSMREIAEAVGIRPASLYHHFGGKEDILWDLTSHALDLLERHRDDALAELAGATARDQLAAFVAAHVRFHALYSEQARIVNQHLDNLGPRRRASAVARRDAYEAGLREILVKGNAERSFSLPDIRIAAFAILQMSTGVSEWYRPDGEHSTDELSDIYVGLVLRLVEG